MLNKIQPTIKHLVFSVFILIASNTNSYAGDIGISQTPLFLGSSVQPNVFFLLDDSGSMDWELLTRQHWTYAAYDPDLTHNGSFDSFDFSGVFIDNGQFYSWGRNNYQRFGYMFSNSNAYGNNCSGTWLNTMENCSSSTRLPANYDWRFRTPGLNVTFYNPSVNYTPWNGPCGASGEPCADANYFAAVNNPKSCGTCSSQTRDLSSDGDTMNGPFKYDVWIDDSGFDIADGRPQRGDNFNETGAAAGAAPAPNNLVDLWDTHITVSISATDAVVTRVTYDPHTSADPSPGLNETAQVLGTLSGSACYDMLGSAANVAAIHAQGATPNINAAGGPGCKTIAEAQTNIANWYSYSRRRMYTAKNAITRVIDAQPRFRYGITKFKGQGGLFIEVPLASVTNVNPHNLDLKDKVYADKQEGIGTFLSGGMDAVGDYFSNTLGGKDNPIKYSCQKNFQIIFTDGYWNDSNSYSDYDGDGVSSTAADIAYRFFKNDLNTSIADNVIPDKGSEADLDPDGDGLTWQHLVSFTVAFGVQGVMSDTDGDGWPNADASGTTWPGDGTPLKSGNWGNPIGTGEIPAKIDDLWHIAWNTNGTYAAASSPEEVVEKLIAAITNIAGRVGSAAAVALNSGTLNANSRVFQASFDSNDWSGRLRSVPIQDGPVDILPLGSPDGIDDSPPECNAYPTLGELCDEEWDAGLKLAARAAASRNIYTFNTDNYAGVAFNTLGDLGAAQQADLKTNPDTAALESDAIGQQRLDYIRGDSSNEGLSAPEFRTRKDLGVGINKMGDIIHSAPAYMGASNFFFPDNLEGASYNAYKIATRSRRPIVYVGANDGMLHAFDASNNATKGEEVFAYVPGKLVNKLPLLTSQSYKNSHTYFVDGSPIAFDAYNGSWNTLLAGSAGAGAQLVYGLNISNPTAFSAADVLWEFTDEPRTTAGSIFGDIDLGYTIGDVAYARMNNNKWVVIFGNGFNNTEADGNVSTTGNAAIYVVDAFTGALIKKFDTQAGMAEDPTGANRANGISRVTPIDVNGDFKADYLYAGDLFGNVWKMDVTSSNSASWASAWKTGVKPRPFYTAKDAGGVAQSITTSIAVKRHPEQIDQTIALFGTGSYFWVNDSSTTQPQTFYAIWDDNTAAQYDRSNLLEQRILNVQNVTGVDGIDREFRVTSSADIDPATYQIDWTNHKGWFMDLTESGERVNVEPVLRGNRIIFVTLTPNADPCSAGGSSWIMEVDANSGSRLLTPPFDVNGDGIISDLDIVNFAGDAETITSGVRSKEGIVAKPGILNTRSEKELKFFSGTTGKIETVTESINVNQRDRQSWRQLR